MKHLVLQLFISGQSARSQTAIAHARSICGRYPEGVCDLEIVDVIQDAERAETQQILATPTLVKLAPLPVMRIVGDMQDLDRVVLLLDPPAASGRLM